MLAGDGHLAFLHRLKQRRLGAGAGAVDLIRHQQLTEHRPFQKAEGAPAIGRGFKDFGAENVGGHQVGRELDAVGFQAHDRGQSVHQQRLAQARQADQQRMAAADQRGKHLINHLFLPDEAPGDRGPRATQPLGKALDLGDEQIGIGHDISPATLISGP